MKNEIVQRKNKSNEEKRTFDDELREIILTKTLGEIVILAEACSTKKINAICTTIFNAIFGTKQNLITQNNKSLCKPDIGMINEIIKRIDGAIPDSEERDNYANLIGDAIEKVFDDDSVIYDNNGNAFSSDRIIITFDDLAIDAIAKAILLVALNENPKMNNQEKKERQVATEIWFSRTGGRKSKPEQSTTKVLYKTRDFTKPLSEGN